MLYQGGSNDVTQELSLRDGFRWRNGISKCSSCFLKSLIYIGQINLIWLGDYDLSVRFHTLFLTTYLPISWSATDRRASLW